MTEREQDIIYLEGEVERLTTQVAALRQCCADLAEITQNACTKAKLSPVGRTHTILNVDIPRILRGSIQ